MKSIIAITLVLLGGFAVAQEKAVETKAAETAVTPKVTISAKGTDVNAVLASVMSQANLQYIIEPGVRGTLHLNFHDMDVNHALMLITRVAKLQMRIEGEIYWFSPMPANASAPAPATPKVPEPKAADPKSLATKAIQRDPTILWRKVSLKLKKADFKAVLAEFTKQTDVKFEVAKDVPAFRLDAMLQAVSLRYAFEHIGKGAQLKFELNDQNIVVVSRAKDAN